MAWTHKPTGRSEAKREYTFATFADAMADPRLFPELRSLVVAHRGASVSHPENTLEAFEAAVAAGAEVLELDVRLSADGVPVVLHDPDVSRCTDGRGFVHELTLSQLKRLIPVVLSVPLRQKHA